ncbi:single-strand selective monofunctional uracil DNA glycosylase [Agrilus planipennis]|uniref:Single-strand selective monofunctional uracil DNA glycosylase n=1 Tax=Agrilus planipennis TaxID=224129 RepID=A0A1W4WWU4_AGRPL|nr:single-strand selective monofunctional uracil DNA glycosylase [Agrilus planipennis]
MGRLRLLFSVENIFKFGTQEKSRMLRKKLKLDPIVQNNSISIQHSTISDSTTTDLVQRILEIEKNMCKSLERLKFCSPVAYVYNPLQYAWEPHKEYVMKYCNSVKPIVFLGINPGPFGMCQTGVPFGQINAVKNFLGIEKPVLKPEKECPSRTITGFNCTRSEISGERFWGYIQKLCGTSEKFFENAFVYNYCPLAFMKNNGTNVTPAELPEASQRIIEEICDEALLQIFNLLQVKKVIGIGRFSEKRAQQVLKKSTLEDVSIYFMPHPSPRVVNNQNWPQKAENFLKENNLMDYFL